MGRLLARVLATILFRKVFYICCVLPRRLKRLSLCVMARAQALTVSHVLLSFIKCTPLTVCWLPRICFAPTPLSWSVHPSAEVKDSVLPPPLLPSLHTLIFCLVPISATSPSSSSPVHTLSVTGRPRCQTASVPPWLATDMAVVRQLCATSFRMGKAVLLTDVAEASAAAASVSAISSESQAVAMEAAPDTVVTEGIEASSTGAPSMRLPSGYVHAIIIVDPFTPQQAMSNVHPRMECVRKGGNGSIEGGSDAAGSDRDGGDPVGSGVRGEKKGVMVMVGGTVAGAAATYRALLRPDDVDAYSCVCGEDTIDSDGRVVGGGSALRLRGGDGGDGVISPECNTDPFSGRGTRPWCFGRCGWIRVEGCVHICRRSGGVSRCGAVGRPTSYTARWV